MKIWKSVLPVLMAVLTAAAVNGCYTMLIHPPVAIMDETTNLESVEQVDHSQRCTDCHTGNVHGSISGSGRYGGQSGINDYDPYWGNDYNGYYDPWFMGSSQYSPYFYDNYYQYNTVPWWLYDSIPESGGSSGEKAVPREKSVRRGGGISNTTRRDSSPSIGSTPGQAGTEKTSTPAPKQDGSSSDDSESDKQKPVRRGGIK